VKWQVADNKEDESLKIANQFGGLKMDSLIGTKSGGNCHEQVSLDSEIEKLIKNKVDISNECDIKIKEQK